MKSVIKENKNKEDKFPKLMIKKTSSLIILAIHKNNNFLKGIVVYVEPKKKLLHVGTYEEDWCSDMFENFDGTIELSN